MADKLRIVIAGSRDFNDYELLKSEVLKVIVNGNCPPDCIEVISGGARGADTLGERFANEFGFRIKRFIPDWNGLGKKAGFVRNADMAKYASEDGSSGVLIAFWDGKSKGTKHMIDLAQRYGLEVYVVRFAA